MELAHLPEAQYYLAPGGCIYCGTADDLSDEHIIPRSLGGQIVLRDASCGRCAREIGNYEAACLQQTFIQARTFLKLPMYKPRYRLETLRLGTADSFGPQIEGFDWTNVPVADHPAAIGLPRLIPPGLLVGRPPEVGCVVAGVQTRFLNGPPPSQVEGKPAGLFLKVDAEKLCRFHAKIAHGAALATLGPGRFTPLLLHTILNRSDDVSTYVGGTNRSRWPETGPLHDISLHLEQGYLVARIRLFSRYGFAPWVVVVGTLRDSPPLYRHWRG
jgi:hypothetical protein